MGSIGFRVPFKAPCTSGLSLCNTARGLLLRSSGKFLLRGPFKIAIVSVKARSRSFNSETLNQHPELGSRNTDRLPRFCIQGVPQGIICGSYKSAALLGFHSLPVRLQLGFGMQVCEIARQSGL